MGGSFEELKNDLRGAIDMAPFLAARQKFAQSGLGKKLQSRLEGNVPRRKRGTSEHDGDWSLDRHWEIRPFYLAERQPTPVKSVTIVADFSVSAAGSAESIDKYGAMVWSIADFIEEFGVQTNIVYSLAGQGSGYGKFEGKETATDYQIRIAVKRAGEYMAPNLLAAVCKTRFFRRTGFSWIASSADLGGVKVCSSLGSPKYFENRIQFKDGELFITADAASGYDAEVEREVLRAIGAKE